MQDYMMEQVVEKYANIEVRDDIVPTATIKLSGTTVEIGKTTNSRSNTNRQ